MARRNWREEAVCKDMDPNLFFDPPNNRWSDEVRLACSRCPAQLDCLNWALHNEEYGFWGGMGPEERTRARRRAGILLGDAPTSVRLHLNVAAG